ncbi:MAG: tryptophan synthase subunit alpha [Acidobacteriota bacterium]|nr:MAG: tryptophan synthase subunit alpha [Acidobacteriota bacterium]
MSGRIEKAFRDLSKNGEKGFIPFITAGDPSLKATEELIVLLAELGSTVIELGVPFTDPMADGPVIQRSSQRALERGEADIRSILMTVERVRKRTDVPIVLFGYMNPFFAYGIKAVLKDAARSGADGFLITDLIDAEFADLSRLAADNGLDLISLVAPTTTDERIRKISENARGFIYAVSRTGVTGKGSEIRGSAEKLVKRLRAVTELPVAVGFGIGSREQVEDVLEFADAAVVGSAIVKVIEETGPFGDAVSRVESFVKELLRKTEASEKNGRGFAP